MSNDDVLGEDFFVTLLAQQKLTLLSDALLLFLASWMLRERRGDWINYSSPTHHLSFTSFETLFLCLYTSDMNSLKFRT